MHTKLMLFAAVAMLLGPVAMACDECEKERAANVSYEDEDNTERVPAEFETREVRNNDVRVIETSSDFDSDYFNASNRFNYTKPAASARLWAEYDFQTGRR